MVRRTPAPVSLFAVAAGNRGLRFVLQGARARPGIRSGGGEPQWLSRNVQTGQDRMSVVLEIKGLDGPSFLLDPDAVIPNEMYTWMVFYQVERRYYLSIVFLGLENRLRLRVATKCGHRALPHIVVDQSRLLFDRVSAPAVPCFCFGLGRTCPVAPLSSLRSYPVVHPYPSRGRLCLPLSALWV